MAILDTVKKIIPYIKTATGYVLCRLSSQAVEMDDGTVLQDKIESMDTTISGKASSSHTHPVSQVTGLTGSRALVSDSSGHPAVSAVTSTELGYLDGAKSNIQSQINSLNSNLGSLIKTQTFTGTVSLPGKGEGSLNMGALKVPTGYTYIGAVAIDSGYGDQFLCSFQRYGSNMSCTVKNLFSSELTGNVTCKALFLKD